MIFAENLTPEQREELLREIIRKLEEDNNGN